MEPVFEHGQLRLYLLVVLADGPLSGYDIIRRLENRFGGLYSPSAGTVYPRLGKLEEDGLVERTTEGRRSTFHITPGGRDELGRRPDDVERLHERLESAHRRLADDMRERVSSGAAELRHQLEDAARLARAAADGTDGADARSAPAPDADGRAAAGSASGDSAGRASSRGTPGPGRDDPFSAFGSALFGRREDGGRNEWGDLAKWFAYAASGGGSTGGSGRGRGFGFGYPTSSRGDRAPASPTGPSDPWGSASDPVRDVDASSAAGERGGTDGADDPAPGEQARTGHGHRQIPDPQQWGEIMTILRDAAGRIQDVLRDDPRQG